MEYLIVKKYWMAGIDLQVPLEGTHLLAMEWLHGTYYKMEVTIRFTLNGKPVTLSVEDERTLLWVLRIDLGLTSVKFGCGEGHCGACTVLIADSPVRTCLLPAAAVEGQQVLTIDGLARNGRLHPLQKAFMEHDALQCGFCTPGMILTAYSLLLSNPHPSESEIKQGLENNLCRCGAHNRIVRAVQAAARGMPGG